MNIPDGFIWYFAFRQLLQHQQKYSHFNKQQNFQSVVLFSHHILVQWKCDLQCKCCLMYLWKSCLSQSATKIINAAPMLGSCWFSLCKPSPTEMSALFKDSSRSTSPTPKPSEIAKSSLKPSSAIWHIHLHDSPTSSKEPKTTVFFPLCSHT